MKDIYLVDALNYLFRAYYAIGPMTGPKGQPTNALFGFIRSINKIIKDFGPENLAVVFDGPENKQSRTKLYEHYKIHRKPMPEDLFEQLEEAKKFCTLANIPTLCVSGVEADDTIGSIVKWAEKNYPHVYVCSSDKDLCQLVSQNTSVININKDNLVIDSKKVEELFGVPPEKMVDFLAIVGDTSDNIPGLEGFGPKTAADLLKKFGSLDYILKNPEQVPGEKKQETLKNSIEKALLSRELATINLNVEFPQDSAFFILKEPKFAELKTFYQEMGFMTLLKELKESSPPQTSDSKETEYMLINDEDSLNELLSSFSSEKELCIDTETTGLQPLLAEMVGIGICSHPKKAYYIPLNGGIPRNVVLEKLKKLLESTSIAFYGHNLKYDLHILANHGIKPTSICFDTLIASYLLRPQNNRHNLDELCLEHFQYKKIPIEDLINKGKNQISMSEVDIKKVSEYCCEDVDFTSRLKNLFQDELKEQNLTSVFSEIEMPLMPILLKMEQRGLYVDEKKLNEMSEQINTKISRLQKQIYDTVGEEFNLNSPKQLSHILFEKLQIRSPKKTQTGYSTSIDVLESLKMDNPIIQEIIDYRSLEKLRSTYLEALPKQIDPRTKRIHCTFNQWGAATGRISCQNPNLQNIPIRSEEGRKIRSAFEPPKGFLFLSGDYSQIELRILAHLSEDPSLIKAFNEGEDIHSFTASQIFNVPLDLVSSEMRYRAKAVNFGILYGQQAFGLSQNLKISVKEADNFIKKYFERYSRVKDYIEFCKEAARKTGRSITITGRQRPILDINSKNMQVRAAAERLAINTPLQGTAADLIKIAMINMQTILDKEPFLGYMVLQIHDELLFEVPEEHLDKMKKLVEKTMESVFSLKVPLSVDISVGKNWGEC